MKEDVIYPTEKSVIKGMLENNIKKITMYLTAYVNSSNIQQWGYK